MEALKLHLPELATEQISNWLQHYNCQLKISRPRQSKLGDYRCPQKGKGHIISINSNLNKYSFLITLTHEIAHMMVWEEHRNRVAPHGNNWKLTFQKLMLNFLPLFPQDILEPLALHLKNPKASSSQDVELVLALRKYDNKVYKTIVDIPMGSAFRIANGKKFTKLKKLRKRYQCRAEHNNRLYLFNPLSEIIEEINPSSIILYISNA